MLLKDRLDPVKAVPQVSVLIQQLSAGLLQGLLQYHVIDLQPAAAVSRFVWTVIQHRRPPSWKPSGRDVLSWRYVRRS